jgi:hypothetical protein
LSGGRDEEQDIDIDVLALGFPEEVEETASQEKDERIEVKRCQLFLGDEKIT